MLNTKGAAKGGGKGGDDVEITNKYRVNKARGEIYRDCYWAQGGLIDQGWINVCRNPLRLESWTETPGMRLHGKDKAAAVQDSLDKVLALISRAGNPITTGG